MRDNMNEARDTVEIDLWKLMGVYLGRWKMIAFVTIAAAVVALGYTALLVTPLYQADVMIYVNNIESGQQVEYISASNLATSQQLVNTYKNIITSDSVLEVVAERLNMGYTAKDIRAMLTAAQVEETEIFEVYITHPDPVVAAQIANTVAEVAPGMIAEVVEGSSTKIIDYAKVPESRHSPSYKKNVLVGAMLGMVMALGYLTLAYLLDVRIRDDEDLTEYFDQPLLGQIPAFVVKDAPAEKKN
ncbi:MAG: hypothetical protein IJZ66_04985 [Oscillibacter sp.]|nr:hypothetical protein [Oscillibacter sp.]MBQ8851778.1 hypothetical protein [Oscillibacter sp.]